MRCSRNLTIKKRKKNIERRRISFCISNSDDEIDFEDDPILKLEPFHDSEVFINQYEETHPKR